MMIFAKTEKICYNSFIITYRKHSRGFFVMELLSSRKNHIENTIVKVGNAVFGDGGVVIIAGPCSIESKEQLFTVADSVKAFGAHVLRGGAFKPRTSPYSFQGLGMKGLDYLLEAGEATGLPVISEIMNVADLPYFEDIDILQIGAKNMQNFSLLSAVGKTDKPVLLKRGAGSTIEELLYSAEYILTEGNPNVLLCERGIRTFENMTRYTFDINAIPLLKELTHLPVIADPSHGTGIASIVSPICNASVAAGADGIMVEVHNDPASALCDGPQAVDAEGFSKLVSGVKQYEKIRSIHG